MLALSLLSLFRSLSVTPSSQKGRVPKLGKIVQYVMCNTTEVRPFSCIYSEYPMYLGMVLRDGSLDSILMEESRALDLVMDSQPPPEYAVCAASG